MAKKDEPKTMYDLMQKTHGDMHREISKQREILLMRQYLKFLEQGYTAEDLIIAQWPPKFEVIEGDGGGRSIRWIHTCELRPKKDMEKYPWAEGCGPDKEGKEEQ